MRWWRTGPYTYDAKLAKSEARIHIKQVSSILRSKCQFGFTFSGYFIIFLTRKMRDILLYISALQAIGVPPSYLTEKLCYQLSLFPHLPPYIQWESSLLNRCMRVYSFTDRHLLFSRVFAALPTLSWRQRCRDLWSLILTSATPCELCSVFHSSSAQSTRIFSEPTSINQRRKFNKHVGHESHIIANRLTVLKLPICSRALTTWKSYLRWTSGLGIRELFRQNLRIVGINSFISSSRCDNLMLL